MKVDKNNIELKLPVYNVQSQLAYIESICKELDLKFEQVLSFILADFILGVQKGLLEEKMDLNEIMFNYFVLAEKQRDSFDKYKQMIDNLENGDGTEEKSSSSRVH